MKKNFLVAIIAIIATPFLLTGFLTPPPQGDYLVLGWNDLGMHCANKNFDSIVILPPYNTIRAQVIMRGNAAQLPQILDTGYIVAYSIPGNTYSAGKTNFWDYDSLLFGVNLPINTGLTGEGLAGSLHIHQDYFQVEGIPVTPFTDQNLNVEDPYQLALLELLDPNNQLLATTQPVVPVSNEINCVSSGCHSSQQDILDEHEEEAGFNPGNLPILCSQCHQDVALGMPGIQEAGSLSEVMHDKHKEHTNDCYKCHPGPNTQCFRDVMYQGGMVCQDCHGSMTQLAQSIKDGRRPWLDEPSCGGCHGQDYAEEPGKLYRESKGHGGLFCSACHGSPHVIFPSVVARDNVQNIALQGHAGTLDDCTVCHGVIPQGDGPHGYNPLYLSNDASLLDLTVDGVTIGGFHPDTLDYFYEVPLGIINPPVVAAVTNDPEATLLITPAVVLPGTTTVLVTAEDGITMRLYSVEFTLPEIHFTEGYETGVPGSWYTGNLNLSSGLWKGKNIRSSLAHYLGLKSIVLKKQTASNLVTPKVNGIGAISFYYKGTEDQYSTCKVQKRIGAGNTWVTIAQFSFNKNGWHQFIYELNDPSDQLSIRILLNNQLNHLLIDEFSLSEVQTATRYNPANMFTTQIEPLKSESVMNPSGPDFKIFYANGNINITGTMMEPMRCNIEIYDLSGRVLASETTYLSSLASVSIPGCEGCLIVRITTDISLWTRKIIAM